MRRPPHRRGMTSSGSSPRRSSTGSSPSARRSPHAVPLVGVWHEGAFAFCTGRDEQKSRNLEVNPQVAVTTGGMGARLGQRQGRRRRGHRDPGDRWRDLQALADAWFTKYGEDWKFEVRGAEFVELSNSGGSTEGGAWVYRVAADKVLAFGDAHGQTAYRF